MRNALLALAACAGLASVASGQVVISQVYGGGGNSGAPLNRDFVELHNGGTTPVEIGGWSLQYASATGTFGGTNSKVDFPPGLVIQPGAYFLVALSQGANAGLPSLPTPDLDTPLTGAGTIAVGSTSGKMVLVNSTAAVEAVTCPTDVTIVDFVGYGPTANCSETAPTPVLSNTTAAIRNSNGCTDTNNNNSDFSIGAPAPRNSGTTFLCPSFADCNNNGVDDAIDISSGTSQDCNSDGVPDECQLAGRDCNGNGQLDSCEIAGNPALDCNGNGTIDSCDVATGFATDVNGNNIVDTCEGAVVVEADANATVLTAGIRGGANGNNFFNVQGFAGGANASYGALRWDIAPIAAALDTAYGVGQWDASQVFLYFQQSNANFTLSSLTDAMQIYYTNNDAQDLSVPDSGNNANTTYPNFATDFADRDLVLNYTFTQGTGGPGGIGSGTREAYALYDLAGGSNNNASLAIASEVNSGAGLLTLVLNTTDDFAVATYAGRTNFNWRGPTLVIFAQSTGPSCDPDVNCDGSPDQGDVACMILAVAGDTSCICQDPDFNQDGSADQGDVAAIIGVVAGQPCP